MIYLQGLKKNLFYEGKIIHYGVVAPILNHHVRREGGHIIMLIDFSAYTPSLLASFYPEYVITWEYIKIISSSPGAALRQILS
jgi:hypothetical protein